MKRALVLIIASFLTVIVILALTRYLVGAAYFPTIYQFSQVTLAHWNEPPDWVKDNVKSGYVSIDDTSAGSLTLNLYQATWTCNAATCIWYGYFFPERDHNYRIVAAYLWNDQTNQYMQIDVNDDARWFIWHYLWMPYLRNGGWDLSE